MKIDDDMFVMQQLADEQNTHVVHKVEHKFINFENEYGSYTHWIIVSVSIMVVTHALNKGWGG